MKICMVLAAHDFPPDIRVEREARSLRDAGHDILILCDTLSANRAREEAWEGCRIVRLPRWPRFLRAPLQAWQAATFGNPRWSSFLRRTLVQFDCDALHVHDLPMLGPALKAARRHGIPVVADMHENYPYALAGYVRGKSLERRIARLLYRRGAWEAYERRCGAASDRVIATAQEMAERLVASGISGEQIALVENTVDAERFLSLPLQPEIVERYRDAFVIGYIGGFGTGEKGLDIAVRAMPEILQARPDALLLLVGRGAAKDHLRTLALSLGVAERLEIVDWRPSAEMPSYIAASAVCLLSFRPSQQYDACSPNKLFQYMAMGKPIVSSSCRSIARIVRECECGLVYDALSPTDLARAVLSLQEPEVRQRFGDAGARAVRERYNWQATASTLIDLYDRLSVQP